MLAKALKPLYGDYGAVDEGMVFDCPFYAANELVRRGMIAILPPRIFPSRETKVLRPPEVKSVRPSDGALVSCIMPTADRRLFVEGAIRNFLAQTYHPKELVIVDDGEHPVNDMVPVRPDVRYYRIERMSIGAKRNRACELAAGSLIAHWDDDDRYSPERLARQVEALRVQQCSVIGLSGITVYDENKRRAWEYKTRKPAYAVGSSLIYRKDWWAKNPFLDQNTGEDAAFVNASARTIAVEDGCGMMVAYRHRGCTSQIPPEGPEFKRVNLNLPKWAEK